MRGFPAVDQLFLHQLDHLAFAHDRIGQVKPGKFYLARQRAGEIERREDPLVERPVHFELERAERVRDALDVIAERMGPVVHRVDIPHAAGLVMLGVANAVEHGIAQPDVRRAHVNARAQGAGAIGKFSRLHARKEIEILLHGAMAIRTFLAQAPELVGFLRGHVADIGAPLANQFDCVGIKLFEIIRGIKRCRPALVA